MSQSSLGRPTGPPRRVARWKAVALAVGLVLLLLGSVVGVRSLSTLQRLADNPPSDGRLQQAHADLVHAMATGLAGAGLALGVGLRGYAVVRRAAS